MRILIIAPEFPPGIGGIESDAGETAARLSARGHVIEVVTAAHNAPSPGWFPFPVHPALGRNVLAGTAFLRRRVTQFAPDVLLLMNAGFAPAVQMLPLRRCPVVVRTAGNDAYAAWLGPRSRWRFLFWRLPHDRPDSIGSRLRKRDQDRRVKAVLGALASCTRILCNSSYSLARLADLGVPAGLLRRMLVGVNTRRFAPGPSRSPRRVPGAAAVLGIAGHLLPIKGVDVALRMLSGWPTGAARITLRIAGTGPEEGRLQSLARQSGIGGSVEFLGSVPPAKMPDFYRGLDLYLQPSVEIRHADSGMLQAESMGLAAAEAQACGVPVIASRSGGLPDVVRDGLTGRLVPPGDPAALGAATSALLDSQATWSNMSETGRRLAVSEFDWEHVIDQTVRHLEEARDALK
jgi:glycosyltransferase involved in cell wall biosynthesis